MKQVLMFSVAFLLGLQLQAQKITPEAIAKLPPEKQEEVNLLMKQGNSAKTASIAISAGGGVLAIVGLAIVASNENADWEDYDESKSEVGSILFVSGCIVALSSIAFTIVKRVKYNKARAIVFAQPGVSMVPGKFLPNTQSVGIQFNIPIGR